MKWSEADAREIIKATLLEKEPEGNWRFQEFADDLTRANRIYRNRVATHSTPTTKQLKDYAAKLHKNARQLRDTMKAISFLSHQHLREAASEWAAMQNETEAFPGLPWVMVEVDLPGGKPHQVIDHRGGEFIARVRDDVEYFAKVTDWLIQTYEPDSKALAGLPAKGGRQRFDAIAGPQGYDGKPISPQVWLIGKELPRLYTKYIGDTYRPRVPERVPEIWEANPNSSVRFAMACLSKMDIKTEDGGDFSFSAIKEYFERAQPPAPTQQSEK